MQGGIFFGKKPLEYVLSVYTNSENAIATMLFAYALFSEIEALFPFAPEGRTEMSPGRKPWGKAILHDDCAPAGRCETFRVGSPLSQLFAL